MFNKFLVTSLSLLLTLCLLECPCWCLTHSPLTLVLSSESQGQKELSKSSCPTPASTCTSPVMQDTSFPKRKWSKITGEKRKKYPPWTANNKIPLPHFFFWPKLRRIKLSCVSWFSILILESVCQFLQRNQPEFWQRLYLVCRSGSNVILTILNLPIHRAKTLFCLFRTSLIYF